MQLHIPRNGARRFSVGDANGDVHGISVFLNEFRQLPDLLPAFDDVRLDDFHDHNGFRHLAGSRLFGFGHSGELALWGHLHGRRIANANIHLGTPTYHEIDHFAHFLAAIGTAYGWRLQAGMPQDAVPLADTLAVLQLMLGIAPVNETEAKIMAHPEWQRGALWGKPRKGHPEGRILYHIADVLRNVEQWGLRYGPEWIKRLRLIALLHDSFKYKVDENQRRIGENHHAMIARRWSMQFLGDPTLLDIIELHDHAYHCWRHGKVTEEWTVAESKLEEIIERLGSGLQLYYMFYRCDTETGDKDPAPVRWFEKIAGDRIVR